MIGIRIIGAIAFAFLISQLVRNVVKPMPHLALRVRPYTASARSLLGRAPDAAVVLNPEPVSPKGIIERVYRPIIEMCVGWITRFFGGILDDEQLGMKLRQANVLMDIPEQDRVHEYRVRQIGSALAFGLAFGAIAALKPSPGVVLLMFAVGLVMGGTRQSARVGKLIEQRRERMRIELYTVNQLMAIYLRTSGSPVLAAQRLCRRGRGAVIDELNEALRLHTRGMSASRAFARIGEQTPEPFAARTYKLLASGSERGADLATALLSLSEDVRDYRRTSLRRNATKRQGAMLIPIIMFLAPVMLLFIAAPIPSMVFKLG